MVARTVIVGAGPAGLFTALSLARRGHPVLLVDRDPGPPPGGSWERRGVMQFHHAHTFRGQVVEALRAELPDVLEHLVAAGAVVAVADDGRPIALLCRRSTFDRVLRAAATAQLGVTMLTGHADSLLREHDRVTGLLVDGHRMAADVVIDASGRASRLTAGVRPPAEGGDCGAVYVTRQYRLRDSAAAGPTNSPIGLSLAFPGYLAIVFVHDARTFSVTFIHDGSDRRLRRLREAAVFATAAGSIPTLAEWIEPARAQPITPVLAGGRLYNSYRGQLAESRVALPGLISVGDAVCTTTPLAGRGVTLALLQARALIRILDHHPRDIRSATMQFDDWCERHIRPWFADHRHCDTDRVRRWSGGDIDLRATLPSDLIIAAAEADPQLRDIVGPYSRMDALPASLAPAQPRARAVFAAGWRPPVPAGPTRAELAQLCELPRYNRVPDLELID